MEKPSKDPQFFTGHLWIMATGSWQVRFAVQGAQGEGVLSIPLPAAPTATRKMSSGLGILLGVLGLLLVAGMVGIVGAAVSKARLIAGSPTSTSDRLRGRIAMVGAAIILVGIVLFGNHWWKAEAASYSGNIYKPLEMTATLNQDSLLDLKLHDPGWLPQRSLDDLIPDHNHLMHLYMVRWPEMDVVFHLHPEPNGSGHFQLPLPSMPAGDYHLYADVVHANGFPETLVSTLVLQDVHARTLAGDDAVGVAKPIDQSNDWQASPEQRFKLPDGYTMIWKKPAKLTPKTPESFQFELVDPQGKAPQDMTLYMGMLGHAAFLKSDGSVFAHIHPDGTMAMAAYMMANPQSKMSSSTMNMSDMPGMNIDSSSLPNRVGFPYGFPSAGKYRIFVQMKHGSTVETGIFDADVAPSGS
jgi:hypothetical protein